MKILAIETSCDETGAAVLEKNENEDYVRVLSNTVATSLDLHAKTGGIIPESAAREQVKYIIPVIIDALLNSQNNNAAMKQYNNLDDKSKNFEINSAAFKSAQIILEDDIDAIAVTYGPGLMGSLLVGVETAKTLAMIFNKPIIPVNHLLAHLYANFIKPSLRDHEVAKQSSLESELTTGLLPRRSPRNDAVFPFIGLIVSGGHTDLLYFKNHDDYEWLGGTRDDAAGEAFDKIGRLLNLEYPAGPEIERRAKQYKDELNGKKPEIKFVSPLLYSDNLDFSFSGLKSEVMRYVMKSNEQFPLLEGEDKGEGKNIRNKKNFDENLINQICYATQKAIIDVLIAKTLKAAEKYNCQTILLGGGVSANQTLLEQFKSSIVNNQSSINIFSPEKKYSTDNAAMIGAYALLNPKPIVWQKIGANPELYFA